MLFIIPCGLLADKIGRKRTLLFSLNGTRLVGLLQSLLNRAILIYPVPIMGDAAHAIVDVMTISMVVETAPFKKA
jgi:MFS family permease